MCICAQQTGGTHLCLSASSTTISSVWLQVLDCKCERFSQMLFSYRWSVVSSFQSRPREARRSLTPTSSYTSGAVDQNKTSRLRSWKTMVSFFFLTRISADIELSWSIKIIITKFQVKYNEMGKFCLISLLKLYYNFINKLKHISMKGQEYWLLKLQSHYSDNQSPTSDNHFFLGGCRRLSEVGKCLSMIADQSAIGCQRITSTTSRRPPTTTFFGVFFGGIRWSANDCRWSPTSRRLVGDWLSEQLVGERFSLQHRKPFADQTSWAFAVHRPWIWIKMVWAFSTHIVYFRFARPQARENRWCAQFGMSARACLLSVY